MRRPMCAVEPSLSYAGETIARKFIYTTSLSLPKGTRLKFHIQSQGRSIDWETPDPQANRGQIRAILPNGKSIAAKPIPSKDSPVPDFEFVLPSEIQPGEDFVIELESRAQTFVQRRKRFLLYIDPKGKGDYKDPEIFTIDIKGNKLSHVQVIAPSVVGKNKRFDIVLRFEDAFGNLTNNAPEGTLIELSYEHLRENLNWKLFIPETGFLSLPNLYFNEPGVYRIRLQNLKTGDTYYSYPVRCFAEQEKSLFWGLLHGESDRFDASENIESCLRHMRDEKSLQFFSTSCFESAEETPSEIWKTINMHVAEFNEEGRFATFLGMQWAGTSPEEGLRMFLFAKDNKSILRKKDPKTGTLKKTYKSLSPKELISIPIFSAGKKIGTDFSDFCPEFERVVEIYNAWGSSECSEKEGNSRPIRHTGKTGIAFFPEGSIRSALNRNKRFGFVAGGWDDRDVFSELYDSEQEQYSPGLTAILAQEHTRESLFSALYNRSCYATTGERIIVGFSLAGLPMGSELDTKIKPGLLYNRHIAGYVSGTAPVRTIEIIRNGTVIHTIKPGTSDPDFTFDDDVEANKAALPGGEGASPFLYYYLRVTQEDGHIAWSSPIWVDISDGGIGKPEKKTKKK